MPEKDLKLYATKAVADYEPKLFVTDENFLYPKNEQKPRILVVQGEKYSKDLIRPDSIVIVESPTQEATMKFHRGKNGLEPSCSTYLVWHSILMKENAYKTIAALGREDKILEAMLDYRQQVFALDDKLKGRINRLQEQTILDRIRGI